MMYIIILILILLISIIVIIYKKVNLKYIKIKKDKIACRKSTIDNPMGNVLYDDYDNKLCLNEDIDTNLKYNYYYDSSDLFLKKNNTRSYITMPSQTHPNDINKFKDYLYNFNNLTCKYNSIDCSINNNVKYYKNKL
jgi:hypothetical protein